MSRINKEQFIRRASRLYEAWNEDDILESVGSIVCNMAFSTEDVNYSKSNSLQHWLFGVTCTDTLLVFTKDAIYFLASDKKAKFFEPLDTKENLHPVVPPFHVLLRNKADKDQANFDKIVGILKDQEEKSSLSKHGHFAKDKPVTEFGKAWDATMKNANLDLADVSVAFAKLFAVKDEQEIKLERNAAQASVNAWNALLKKKIVDIVDQDKKIKHNRLADELEEQMTNVKVQGPLAGAGLEACYSPIVQSGDNCSLKLSAPSPERMIHFSAIIGMIGIRESMYCSNLGRTIMVQPTELMEELYELLLTTQAAIVDALKPGKLISDAYKAGLEHFRTAKPDYEDYFVKSNFGFVTGIEFRESHLLIGPNCNVEVKANMTFVVSVGLQNFPNPRAKEEGSKKASIFLSDTILVSAEGPNEYLTGGAKSKVKSNAIRFKEAETAPREEVATGRSKRSVILQEQTRHKETNEEKRKERQRELADILNKEAQARLAALPGAANTQKVKKSNVSYKSEDKFPTEDEVSKLMIYVDKRHDTVILPIFGVAVPFHISMIKNTSQSVEGDYTYLRINFTHPGSQIGKDNALFPNPLAHFVKELSFRATNQKDPGELHAPSTNLSTAFRLIKEMQKRFRSIEAEEREKEGAVKQDKLLMSQAKGNPKLKDLYVRPNVVPKKVSGSIEAHVNGFRYNSLRGDKIDVLYNNIKHAFFQPCDKEMIILLHFHLKNPIMLGKKKHTDIQFFTEVGEITTDLGKYHHMQDRDDIQSEQMEREMRKKLNMAFQNFCDKVVRLTNEQVDFDTPFPELAFHGVPYRSSVELKPTSSCLVHLTEWPPFVVTLDEVELVHFERVTSNTKSFDLVIVFKDYRKKVQQIGQIPSSSLDSIKDWLNSCDIRYSEGPISLNWNNIMKTIVDDPEAFFENGGWNFLLSDSDDEDAEDDSEESEFEPSGDDSDVSDEDEDEGSSAVETEESESEGDLESDESSGKDWDELEEEAARGMFRLPPFSIVSRNIVTNV
ncbi:FACT complex subunit SPT16 [Aphelenchoides avenae]|nr:FACT complex subunit SPT16 [Aphelenchus avenae]